MEGEERSATRDDPVLRRFRAALQAIYGDRLERVVLFGSRARGDHAPDSDYDVGVFLRDFGGLWEELGLLAEVGTDILLDTGAVISAKPFRASARMEATALMLEIGRDGLEV